MTTYIKDLIDLPEKVHGGHFVLKLTEGVEHPDQTLRPYVVTPEFARNFDDALDFIKGGVNSSCSETAGNYSIASNCPPFSASVSSRTAGGTKTRP